MKTDDFQHQKGLPIEHLQVLYNCVADYVLGPKSTEYLKYSYLALTL